MATGNRRGGILEFKINGEMFDAKGNFTYGLGKGMREAVIGSDGVHGYKETPQAPFIEGEITDRLSLSLDALAAVDNATITLKLANDKVIALRGAWSVNKDGLSGSSEEGAIPVRFEGLSAEEIR